MTTPLTAPAPLLETVSTLRSGEVSLAQHVARVCDRIEEVDPQLLALLPEPNRHKRLLREAADLERRCEDSGGRPALYGALIGVKDIFRVDGFATGGGTALPSELFDGPEAACVTRLKAAGALVLGKTVTTEFAAVEPGPTRNPHDPRHTPGGSSSGSAAAVAAGLAGLAFGSQTIGSVIRPAAFCGIVGFKPSFDRIPTAGILYFSRTVDTVGLFTQDAAGMALAASALLDGWDAETHGREARRMPALGVPDGPYLRQTEPDGLEAFERQVGLLGDAGFAVRRVPALEDIDAISARHGRLISSEFAEAHRTWFDRYGALYRPGTAAIVERGRRVTAAEQQEARESCLELRERIHRLMDEHRVELWASPPAVGAAPRGLSSTGDPAMNLPWTHAGLTTVTLPAGRAKTGLPLGLQLTARFRADESLLAWAEAVEPVLAGASSTG